MKKYLIYHFVIFAISQLASGVTLLRVEGVIEEQLVGDWPEIGTPFDLSINYDRFQGPFADSDEPISYLIFENSFMILGGVEYVLDLTSIAFFPGSNGMERVALAPQNFTGGPESIYVGVSFTGPTGFVDDPLTLPGSLEEWRLDEAGFVLEFDFEDENGRVLARTSSYSRLSITTIPEPSFPTIMAMGIILPVLRRRRDG